jgi:hypothetical protein
MTATLDSKAKTLTIVIPIACDEKGNVQTAPSASGKTQVVASSHGNQTTTCIVNGKPLTVGLNAYIKA